MKKNRVIGVLGIGSMLANWNADFNLRPKTLPDGTIFGSGVTMKRAIRDALEELGATVFYKKTLVFDPKKKVYKAATIAEKYVSMFGEETKDRIATLKQLLKATDVRAFGVLFTGKENNNIGYNGTVQFYQGLNFDKDTEVVTQSITGTFASGTNESSAVGKKVFTDEAHYLYNLTIDSANNRFLTNEGLLEEDEVFSEEDYELFKEASKFCATRLQSAAKVSCYNEFCLFVEFVEGSDKYLSDLASTITMERGERTTTYDISGVWSVLTDPNVVDHIKKVELFYETNRVNLVIGEVPTAFEVDIKSIFE